MDFTNLVSPTEGEARKAEEQHDGRRTSEQRVLLALNDAQLKELVLGKTYRVRNRVTGERIEMLYGKDGRRLIPSVNGKQPQAGEILAM